MSNEFIARNGLIAQNNSTVTGSLNVTGGITGSLQGTATTASYVTTAQTASYTLNAVSASYALNSDLLDGKDSTIFATTGSNTFIGNQIVTGSFNISGSITGSSILLTQVTSSIANPYGDIILSPSGSSINTGSVEIQGGLKWKRNTAATTTEIGDLITFGGTMGLIEGGTLTTSSVGGLVAQAGVAVMYTMNTFPFGSHNITKYTTEDTTDASRQITLPQTSSVYVYYNNSGVLTSADTAPSSRSNVILGKVTTDASNIIYIDASQINAHHYSNYADRLFREALGPIFSTGGITTQGTTSGSLDVTAATYFFSQNRITTNASTNISMDTFYKSSTPGQYVRTTGVSLVSTSSYDSGSGALENIPSGKYVKHSLYLLGDNSLQSTATEAYMMVYGQTIYNTIGDAEAGSLPSPPSYFIDAISIIASLVVTPDSQSIQTIIDERPRLGFVSPSKTGVITAHGDLSGLLNDDHPQYLLTDGTRMFTSLSGSQVTATSFTGSLSGTATTASYVLNAVSSSYASTASYLNTLSQDLTFNGNLTLNGTASITYLNVSYESSSIIYSSGSNQLGDATNDVQTLIGRTIVSGSFEVTGSTISTLGFTGSLKGTADSASYVTNAQTASYVQNAQTASYVLSAVSSSLAQTASYVTTAQTASYVTLAQTASYVTTAQTASYVLSAVSSSFAQTASYVQNAQTASYVTLAQTASYVTTAQTASYVTLAQTASYVTTAQTASYASSGTGIFSGSFSGSFIGNGSGLTGVTATSAPGGANTTIQFNDNGLTSGSGTFTFDKTNNIVTLTGSLNISGSINVSNNINITGSIYSDGAIKGIQGQIIGLTRIMYIF